MPAILIASVLLLSWLLADTPILVLIAVGALLVTATLLLLRRGATAALGELGRHVVEGLPRIVNELCLFLAAGVLAAGISALILHGVIDNPFSGFDAVRPPATSPAYSIQAEHPRLPSLMIAAERWESHFQRLRANITSEYWGRIVLGSFAPQLV